MNREKGLPPTEEERELRAFLPSVLLLTTIFLINFVSRIVLGPLMPTIEGELNLSHGQAGSLFFLISAGYCVVISLSGFVSARLNHRRAIALSALAMGVALLFVAFSGSIHGMRWGLVLLGMAGGLYLPSGLATITRMVRPKDWGKAIAVHELAPNLGFVITPFLAEFLGGWLSWRGLLVVLSICSLAGAGVFLRFGKGGDFPGTAPSGEAIRILSRNTDFWIMIFLFSLGVGVSLGIYTMLPLFLVAHRGWEVGWTNSVVGLSRIPSLGMAIVGGWASDRVGPRRALGTVFLITGVLTVLIGYLEGSWLVLMVFLQPAVAVCFFPAAIATLAQVGPERVRNLTVSLTIPVAFLVGAGGVPAMIGHLGEAGRFPLGIALVGAIMIFSPLLTRNLARERRGTSGGEGERRGPE